MSATPHDLDEVTPVPPPLGPGERLRVAREAASMSIQEVSTAMRLNRRVVQALEADDYSDLPVPAFVRGYLRGYARLLDLPPEPIIEAFEQRELAPPAMVPDISDESQVRSGDFPVRLITCFVVAALVVLVVIWWRSQHFTLDGLDVALPGELAEPDAAAGGEPAGEAEDRKDGPQTGDATAGHGADAALQTASGRAPEALPEPATPPGEAPEPVPLPEAVPESAMPPGEAPEPVPLPEALPEPAPPPEGVAADAGDSRVPEAEAVPGGALSAPAPEEDEAPSQPPPSWEEYPAEDIDVAAIPAAVQETPNISGDRIEMRFGAECWVEVYDDANERIYYGLVEPGQTLSGEGKGPMRLVVGNSEGVERVRYNGTLVDVSRFVTGGVARFSVGGQPPAAFRSR